MNEKTIVNVITVTFNSEKTVSETIESVLNQTYRPIRHIIIDGLSTDYTLDVINKFKEKYLEENIDLFVLCEKDQGIYDAINKGINNSKDGIVGILNSDDIFYSNYSIQIIVDNLKVSNSQIVYSNLNIYDNNLKFVKRSIISRPFKKGLFERSWTPPHPTFYTYKHNYLKYGFYNKNYKIAGDGELMFRFLEIYNLESYYINDHLVKMRFGGVSTKNIKSTLLITKETSRYFKYNGFKFNYFKYLFFKFFKVVELINKK